MCIYTYVHYTYIYIYVYVCTYICMHVHGYSWLQIKPLVPAMTSLKAEYGIVSILTLYILRVRPLLLWTGTLGWPYGC